MFWRHHVSMLHILYENYPTRAVLVKQNQPYQGPWCNKLLEMLSRRSNKTFRIGFWNLIEQICEITWFFQTKYTQNNKVPANFNTPKAGFAILMRTGTASVPMRTSTPKVGGMYRSDRISICRLSSTRRYRSLDLVSSDTRSVPSDNGWNPTVTRGLNKYQRSVPGDSDGNPIL